MTYLLDSHTFIWSVIDPVKLSTNVSDILEDPHQSIFISSISFWEIALKYALGKLQLNGVEPIEFPSLAKEVGFDILPLDSAEASTYHLLQADWHRDPFDRMLIWQAIQQKMVFISADKNVAKYQSVGLTVLW